MAKVSITKDNLEKRIEKGIKTIGEVAKDLGQEYRPVYNAFKRYGLLSKVDRKKIHPKKKD